MAGSLLGVPCVHDMRGCIQMMTLSKGYYLLSVSISSFESQSMLEISRWTRIWVQHSRAFLAVRITFPEVRNRKGIKSGLVQQ